MQTLRETNFRKTYLRNLFFENCHSKNSFARDVPIFRTVGTMMLGAVIASPVVGANVAECRQCVVLLIYFCVNEDAETCLFMIVGLQSYSLCIFERQKCLRDFRFSWAYSEA